MNEIIRFLLLIFALSSVSVVGVDVQYLGDYLSPDEISQDNLCGTKECLLDANRLVDAATRQWSVKPCEDFREFSMGNFIKLKALHDRYDRVGFLFDVLALHYERQRKAFAEPIAESDPRAFKIVKNFFQKCIDSSVYSVTRYKPMCGSLSQTCFRLHQTRRKATCCRILEDLLISSNLGSRLVARQIEFDPIAVQQSAAFRIFHDIQNIAM